MTEQIRKEIETLEASREETWALYNTATEEANKKLAEYVEQSHDLSELYLEEQLELAKERRGNKSG